MPETHRALPEAMNCVEKAAACVAATRDLWRIANSQWNRKLQRIHRKTSLKWNDAAVLELDSVSLTFFELRRKSPVCYTSLLLFKPSKSILPTIVPMVVPYSFSVHRFFKSQFPRAWIVDNPLHVKARGKIGHDKTYLSTS